MADQDKPQTIVARIEALIADLHTTSPSGAETLHEKIRAGFDNLRGVLTVKAPEPEPTASFGPFSPKAKADDTESSP